MEAVNIENHYCCDVSDTDVSVYDFHIPDHVESLGSEVEFVDSSNEHSKPLGENLAIQFSQINMVSHAEQ